MNALEALIDYYKEQGAPGDQQMLIALLREAQAENGGVLTADLLPQIAAALSVKESLLAAIIRRIPTLRMADAPHRLEMCQTCPKGRQLRAWVETTWHVQSGKCSPEGGFSYHVTPCMKNCKNGPSIKWDGVLHSHATKELITQLIHTGGKSHDPD